MQQFLDQYADRITGVLSGFDRVLFRGNAIDIGYLKGMDNKLFQLEVRYERYFDFVKGVSKEITNHAKALAAEVGRPVIHLNSPKASKEEVARFVQQRDDIQEGLICVLTCVESCQTYALRRRGENNWLTLVPETRKCQFLYFYLMDPEFGFMHVRLQTWLPMTMQACINGREYLARQMTKAGIGFEKRDNCFTRIDDLPQAQRLLAALETRDWSKVWSAYARRFNPFCGEDNRLKFKGYYWTFRQTEYATDVMFRDAQSLTEIYPALVRHATEHFQAPSVMSFFNRKLTERFGNEIRTETKRRQEGTCVKHFTEENSIKMYDKQGSVLRIETTMNNPGRFKVRRWAIRNGQSILAWFHLRKGVVDIERRVEICRAANGRYLDALAVVGLTTPAKELLDPVSKPIVRQGRPYRALRPLAPDDAQVMQLMLMGLFLVQGFRNRDIVRALHGHAPQTLQERRRRTARVTRLLRLFRAHGMIRKVPHTFQYRVTKRGRHTMTTALALRELNLAQLAV